MSAWNAKLYGNDTACDVRDDYIELLRNGMGSEEACDEIIRQSQDIISDKEDSVLFWLALADTQWKYGRLQPKVRDMALQLCAQKADSVRWADAGEEKLREWHNTLEQLEAKLQTPQPVEKRVYKRRLYRCQWQLGDVFAYRFDSVHSEEKGYKGKYICFRKVSENICWPGHVVPVVQVFKRIDDEPPSLQTLQSTPLLEQQLYKTEEVEPENFAILLMNTSGKAIPDENIHWLGNWRAADLIPLDGAFWDRCNSVGWNNQRYNNKFEEYIIRRYEKWLGYV